MLITGAPLKMDKALKAGVIDAIAKDKASVVDEAAAMALARKPDPISKREVPKANRFKALGGALDMAENQAFNTAKGMIAPSAIITCVRAACSGISFQEGLKVEGREFTRLLFSVQSAALRHLFFAERLANKVPGNKATSA